MNRRNKQFIEEQTEKEQIPLKEQVYRWILNQEDGATFGETYMHFNKYSPRYLREHIRNLKDMGLLRTETCRCHCSTVYHGIKK
jgi:hypothetical protein